MVQMAGLLGGFSTDKIRRQQGGGGVMMWAEIIINVYRILCRLLKKAFLTLVQEPPLALERKMIFMHDNVLPT